MRRSMEGAGRVVNAPRQDAPTVIGQRGGRSKERRHTA